MSPLITYTASDGSTCVVGPTYAEGSRKALAELIFKLEETSAWKMVCKEEERGAKERWSRIAP